jgi:hypothetical protein
MNILFILMLSPAIMESQFTCPNATNTSSLFFTFITELFYGTNATCSAHEENSFFVTINDALTNMNVATSRKSPRVIDADLCSDDGMRRDLNSEGTLHRNLQIRKSYTWSGTASKWCGRFLCS